MRILPLLLALLLAGCLDPGPGPNTTAASGAPPEPGGAGSPREPPEGMEWYRDTLVPSIPMSPTEEDLASPETRWGYAAQVWRHCRVEAPEDFGTAPTGFLHRDDGAPDDPLTRMADALGLEVQHLNDTVFRIGDARFGWEGDDTLLLVALPSDWDLDRTATLLAPLLGNATHEPDDPGVWVQSWYHDDQRVRYEVVRLHNYGTGYWGSVFGPLPDLRLVDTDAAWNAARGYGACAEDIGWPWDWDGWHNATMTTEVALDAYDGGLLYGLRFEDRYGESWSFRVNAHTGKLHSA